MYAVILDRSRQYTVRKGDVILCDFDSPNEPGEKVTFDQVLMVAGEGVSQIGKPTVAGASVSGEVIVQRASVRPPGGIRVGGRPTAPVGVHPAGTDSSSETSTATSFLFSMTTRTSLATLGAKT